MTLVPRWLVQFARPSFSFIDTRDGLTRRRRRRAWLDLVSSSPHLQHDLGLIDMRPQKRSR